MDQVRNEEVRMRSGVTRELAGQAECVLRWSGYRRKRRMSSW